MAFDFPEALELTPSANLTWQAVTGPMVSQLTVNKTESAASERHSGLSQKRMY